MSSYFKFLKDIFFNKRHLKKYETVALMQECTSAVKNKLPTTKLKDPRSFTNPWSIGGIDVRKTLIWDLGTSINLMPLSVLKRLRIGDARPTFVTLQLVDISIKHPEGKIENVLVKVDKSIFPAYFIILDYEADTEISIILGKIFLATCQTLFDMQKGELTIQSEQWECDFSCLQHDEIS